MNYLLIKHTLLIKFYYYSYFIDEENGSLGNVNILPMVSELVAVELEFKFSYSDSSICC